MKGPRATLFIISVLAYGYAFTQSFSNLYVEGRPAMLFGSMQLCNGKFYFTGVTSTVRSPYYTKALFGKINSDGNVDYIHSILDSNNYKYDLFQNSLKKCADGVFITTGDKYDSIQKAFIAKIDTDGNILLWREYTDSGNLISEGMDVIETRDSGYLLAVNVDFNHMSCPEKGYK